MAETLRKSAVSIRIFTSEWVRIEQGKRSARLAEPVGAEIKPTRMRNTYDANQAFQTRQWILNFRRLKPADVKISGSIRHLKCLLAKIADG